MRIVIPGGSGQVGTILARAFHASGDDVVVLSRAGLETGPYDQASKNALASTHTTWRGRPSDRPGRLAVRPWRVAMWDGGSAGAWEDEIDGCDAVINLAGRSVNCRYNATNRRNILESRVRSTRIVGEAIARAAHPPRVWLQASTATIYRHRYDAANDERSGILGGGEAGAPPAWQFSIDVARAWERTFAEAVTERTRKVALRSAMTLSPDRGGVFDTLLGLVRRGLGGRAGDGRQFMSWIHHEDFVAAVRWLIDREGIDGIVNVASPNPLPNAEFMRLLREAAGVPSGLPAREWMLEIGAVFMRTETELVLKSRRVVPGRLIEHGFTFRFPDWEDAARDLCRRWKLARGHATAAACLKGF